MSTSRVLAELVNRTLSGIGRDLTTPQGVAAARRAIETAIQSIGRPSTPSPSSTVRRLLSGAVPSVPAKIIPSPADLMVELDRRIAEERAKQQTVIVTTQTKAAAAALRPFTAQRRKLNDSSRRNRR